MHRWTAAKPSCTRPQASHARAKGRLLLHWDPAPQPAPDVQASQVQPLQLGEGVQVAQAHICDLQGTAVKCRQARSEHWCMAAAKMEGSNGNK